MNFPMPLFSLMDTLDCANYFPVPVLFCFLTAI
jgi:hypothetical protein